MLSPKEAFEKEKEFIPLKEAGGRICGEPIGTYSRNTKIFTGELIDAHGLNEFGKSGLVPICRACRESGFNNKVI